MEPIFTPHSPQNCSTLRLIKTQQCGLHMRRKSRRIVEHFWGLWCAKIASALAPKAL